MIRQILAVALAVGFLAAVQPSPADAQTAAPAAGAKKKPMAKKATAKKTMSHSHAKAGGKKSMAGHKMDNIADKLNACQAKAMGERQSCMDQALKS